MRLRRETMTETVSALREVAQHIEDRRMIYVGANGSESVTPEAFLRNSGAASECRHLAHHIRSVIEKLEGKVTP